MASCTLFLSNDAVLHNHQTLVVCLDLKCNSNNWYHQVMIWYRVYPLSALKELQWYCTVNNRIDHWPNVYIKSFRLKQEIRKRWKWWHVEQKDETDTVLNISTIKHPVFDIISTWVIFCKVWQSKRFLFRIFIIAGALLLEATSLSHCTAIAGLSQSPASSNQYKCNKWMHK